MEVRLDSVRDMEQLDAGSSLRAFPDQRDIARVIFDEHYPGVKYLFYLLNV